MVEVRIFSLEAQYKHELEVLLCQLADESRSVHLDNYEYVCNVGAFDGDRLIGFAQLFILPKTTFIIGHIEDVIVHKDYRGQGVGNKMLELIIATARSQGCKVINLTTRKERVVATALFESKGFVHPGNQIYRLVLEN
jgi:ribosomal protein S18 acetylase RimI-like enzyme